MEIKIKQTVDGFYNVVLNNKTHIYWLDIQDLEKLRDLINEIIE